MTSTPHSEPSISDKLAYLSMTCANPSDHLSAGVWCETANEAYMLASDLFEQLEALHPYVQHRSTCILNVSQSVLRKGDWCDCGLREVLGSNPAISPDSVEQHEVTAEDEDRIVKAALEREDSAPASRPS